MSLNSPSPPSETNRQASGSSTIEHIAGWLGRPLKNTSLADVPELSASLGTTVGEVRADNQDRALMARFTSARRPESSFLCFALCDGMGGMVEGARCAEIALSSFIFQLTRATSLGAADSARFAIYAANSEVYERYRERGGTTLAAIVAVPGASTGVSVGDSRIYSVTPRKALKQVSIDDTIAGELNRLTGLRTAQSGWASFAGQLAQFVGIGDALQPRIYSLNPETPYLLTSDGIHNVNADALERVTISSGTPFTAVSRLLQLSRWCGGEDNATLIYFGQVSKDRPNRPTWATCDWLEIWDSGGKLELPISESAPALVRQVKSEQQVSSWEQKTTRQRKRGSRAKKGADVAHSPKPAAAQGSLKIEIEDQPAKVETAATPGTGSASPNADMQQGASGGSDGDKGASTVDSQSAANQQRGSAPDDKIAEKK